MQMIIIVYSETTVLCKQDPAHVETGYDVAPPGC